MKKWASIILVIAAVATAASIKVWGPGDILSSSDLNANFAHIHNTMVGGHGPRLIDADVAPSAAIAHSKLANPFLIPKVLARTNGVCSSSPCSLSLQNRVASITRVIAGAYLVNFSPALANSNFLPILTTQSCPSSSPPCVCGYEPPVAAGEVGINCYDRTGTATDAAFTVAVFDDND